LRTAVRGNQLASKDAALQLVRCLRRLEAGAASKQQQGAWLQQALARVDRRAQSCSSAHDAQPQAQPPPGFGAMAAPFPRCAGAGAGAGAAATAAVHPTPGAAAASAFPSFNPLNEALMGSTPDLSLGNAFAATHNDKSAAVGAAAAAECSGTTYSLLGLPPRAAAAEAAAAEAEAAATAVAAPAAAALAGGGGGSDSAHFAAGGGLGGLWAAGGLPFGGGGGGVGGGGTTASPVPAQLQALWGGPLEQVTAGAGAGGAIQGGLAAAAGSVLLPTGPPIRSSPEPLLNGAYNPLLFANLGAQLGVGGAPKQLQLAAAGASPAYHPWA
jgi:hypothetical protein